MWISITSLEPSDENKPIIFWRLCWVRIALWLKDSCSKNPFSFPGNECIADKILPFCWFSKNVFVGQMSLRGGPFDFRGKEGDLEKESPAGTLLPKNIRAHYYCYKNRKKFTHVQWAEKTCFTKYNPYRPIAENKFSEHERAKTLVPVPNHPP